MEKRWFEVWILGYDKDMLCTDIEELVGEYATKEKAFEKAQSLTLESVFEDDLGLLDPDYLEDGDILAVIVEEVYEPEFDVCQAVASWEIKYLEYKE
jgi:hypothetical protein